MKKWIKTVVAIEKEPVRGLIPLEWATLAYAAVTLAVILCAHTGISDPQAMIRWRAQVVFLIAGLWLIYRLVPNRLTMGARVTVELCILALWYPDTHGMNALLPNFDHVFASWEQTIFHCQPAMLFSVVMPGKVTSELMAFGYAFYYPMIAVIGYFYLFCRYADFQRAVYVIGASFFTYYIIFDFLPVAGPTFYFNAIGLDNVMSGVFPSMGTYFATHNGCFATPGWTDGLFYRIVEFAKATGECPTAAFPSSHVGVAVVCQLLAWHSRSKILFVILLPITVLLCLSTVYIQAHYVIDGIAGLVTGVVFYFIFMNVPSRKRSAKASPPAAGESTHN